MESYTPYKKYGITYNPYGGVTTVDIMGITLRTWTGHGERIGVIKAKSFIDNRIK